MNTKIGMSMWLNRFLLCFIFTVAVRMIASPIPVLSRMAVTSEDGDHTQALADHLGTPTPCLNNEDDETMYTSSFMYKPLYQQVELHDQQNHVSYPNEDRNAHLRGNQRRHLVSPPKIPQVGTRRLYNFDT